MALAQETSRGKTAVFIISASLTPGTKQALSLWQFNSRALDALISKHNM